MTRTSNNRPDGHARRRGRWITLAAASVLLHAFLVNWAGGRIALPSLPAPKAGVVTMALNPPPSAQTEKPVGKPAMAEAGKRAAASGKKKHPPPVPQAAASPQAETTQPTESADTGNTAGMAPAIDQASATPVVEYAPAPLPDTGSQPEPAVRSAAYKVSPPPPAELKYDAVALHRGQSVHGSGRLRWNPDGDRYSISGEASVLFLTLLDFTSTGSIDASGIAPELYREKPFRKSETNTHFHRERDIISFSASTLSYPRQGGEQDRGSVIWQLAGIGRGDTGQIATDAEIALFVAGTRDGEPWKIRVVGQEEIETGLGKLLAWHLVRVPRQGSYDKKLDIWLAPQQQWYPVRLRYTDRNGDYLDLSLSNLVTGD